MKNSIYIKNKQKATTNAYMRFKLFIFNNLQQNTAEWIIQK